MCAYYEKLFVFPLILISNNTLSFSLRRAKIMPFEECYDHEVFQILLCVLCIQYSP